MLLTSIRATPEASTVTSESELIMLLEASATASIILVAWHRVEYDPDVIRAWNRPPLAPG